MAGESCPSHGAQACEPPRPICPHIDEYTSQEPFLATGETGGLQRRWHWSAMVCSVDGNSRAMCLRGTNAWSEEWHVKACAWVDFQLDSKKNHIWKLWQAKVITKLAHFKNSGYKTIYYYDLRFQFISYICMYNVCVCVCIHIYMPHVCYI